MMLTIALILLGCNSMSDKSGDYKLVDIQVSGSTMSSRQYEKGLAEALGQICHIEKVGDYYKMTADGDPDAIVFKSEGDEYIAYEGKMQLSFTSSGAKLHAKDDNSGMECTWVYEKQ